MPTATENNTVALTQEDTMPTAKDILTAARAIVSDPAGWTKDHAPNYNPFHPHLKAIDAFGAIYRAEYQATAPDFPHPTEQLTAIRRQATRLLLKATGARNFDTWHRNASHSEMLAAFDKAIATA